MEAQGEGVPAVSRAGVLMDFSYLEPHVGRQNVPTSRTEQRGARGKTCEDERRDRRHEERRQDRILIKPQKFYYGGGLYTVCPDGGRASCVMGWRGTCRELIG